MPLSGGGQEASLELFAFSGTLNAASLAGTLKRSDLRHSTRPNAPQEIRLKLISASSLQAGSYREWLKMADEILDRRGPK
jgi:citrate lyase gamma subunit